jgi:periplasmic copper chaperone A
MKIIVFLIIHHQEKPMKLNKKILIILSMASLLIACKAKPNAETDTQTSVAITDSWVRANAPGQSVGAAYMTLNSPQDSTLVYVETPVADSVEIHSMSMENNVMKMRMLEELPLKAGKPEKLSPGGYHLMLFDLTRPLNAGENAAFKLCFKDQAGNITHQNVSLPIKSAD